MNTTVRLQRPWDIDLITLSKHPDFNFSYWVKQALIAWSMDDTQFIIPCPPKADIDDNTADINRRLSELFNKAETTGLTEDEKIEQKELKKGQVVTIHIRLEPEKDKNLIEKLGMIQEGYRNSFIKNLIRHYMDKPYAYTYGPEFLFENLKKADIPETKKAEAVIDEGKIESTVIENKIVTENKKKPDIKSVTEDKKKQEKIPELPKTTVIEEENTSDNESDSSGFDLFGAIDKMM